MGKGALTVRFEPCLLRLSKCFQKPHPMHQHASTCGKGLGSLWSIFYFCQNVFNTRLLQLHRTAFTGFIYVPDITNRDERFTDQDTDQGTDQGTAHWWTSELRLLHAATR